MKHVAVVGSGASGVHFAAAALERGHRVVMIDVGHAPPPATLPDATYSQLKRQLSDPAEYFLGRELQGALLPGDGSEYYGIPPSKDYVFEPPAVKPIVRSSGFEPLFSFAQGGLAQAWTGGCYPFNDGELQSYPFGYDEIAPYYDEVARDIGINGANDDLSPYFPVHPHLMPGLDLDEHAQLLLTRYERKRSTLNQLGAFLGRSRAATLSSNQFDRRGCWHCGRCLWGCPSQSLYTPAQTLARCQQHANFQYQNGLLVDYLRLDHDDRASGVVARRQNDGREVTIEADDIVLAAGTLGSARIFLESLRRNRREVVRLPGLMDNRQALVPFLTLSMMGRPVGTDHYQYHQLMMAIDDGEASNLIHCQITTLKSAAVHPIIQSIPLGLQAAIRSFREIRAALGILNVNLPDTRRNENYLTLDARDMSQPAPLVIRYEPPTDEPPRLRRILRRVRRCLWKLGALAPPPMTHVRPMGASVHYAGVLPMSLSGQSLTTDVNCRSRDISNLYFVDGTTFCFLPAKNLTFTLMANARRVAASAF